MPDSIRTGRHPGRTACVPYIIRSDPGSAVKARNLDRAGLEHLGSGRNIVGQPEVASYDAVVTDPDPAENRCVGIYSDIVLENGMAGFIHRMSGTVIAEIARTQSNSLLEHAMPAYDAGRPDDHTGAVVDGEVLSDDRSGMDVDSRLAVGHLRKHSRYAGNAKFI